jgi:hypothetical protein
MTKQILLVAVLFSLVACSSGETAPTADAQVQPKCTLEITGINQPTTLKGELTKVDDTSENPGWQLSVFGIAKGEEAPISNVNFRIGEAVKESMTMKPEGSEQEYYTTNFELGEETTDFFIEMTADGCEHSLMNFTLVNQ